MFDRLGHAIARRPKFFVFGWVVLLVLGGTAALWGFGQGNLFARMQSSESMVPDTESDVVIQKTKSVTSPESAIVVVEGISPSAAESEVDAFRSELLSISGVETVVDPLDVDKQFAAGQDKAVNDAVAQAIAANQAAIDGAAQKAIAQAEPQIQQAVAGAVAQFRQANPGAPTEQVAAQARQQASDEVERAAREAATKRIEDEVRATASEQASKEHNPADDLRQDAGFVVVVNVHGTDTNATPAILAATDRFQSRLQQVDPSARANVSSGVVVEDAIMNLVKKDLLTGEAIGLPIALFLLIVVFGGLLAAGLPLVGGITSIAVGMGLLWVLTHVTNVDTFVLNIFSIIGLALSIDYGLLIVSRFREEVARQRSSDSVSPSVLVARAIATTVTTAGRTVTFSALTIAFAISGLLLMDAPMLKMIGLGGIIVTLLAVATAVMMVPAMITMLGARLVRPSWFSRAPLFGTLVKKVGDAASDEGLFSRLAQWVHRRPWQILLAVAAVLIVMAMPIRDLQMRSNFMEYIPAHTRVSQAYDGMQKYQQLATPSVSIIAETVPKNTDGLVEKIRDIAPADWVSVAEFDGDQTLVKFHMPGDPVGPEVTDVVKSLRSYEPGYNMSVGGPAALQLDFTSSIRQGAPLAFGVVAGAVLVLLFFMTGSVIAPVKALVINSLSLLAGMGATVFAFEHGLFGLPQSQGLETFVVASAMAFGLGLAMDYEVFLLARIKEYWDSGETNDDAVAKGLQRSGRVITSAAAIIIAVFIGFIFGDMLAIKQVGVALALIVTIDATLVRMLLVPATMTILGRWNWWVPAPLKRLYEKLKIVH